MKRQRRRSLGRVAAIFGSVALLISIPGMTQSVVSPALFTDLFDDPNSGWATYANLTLTYAYQDGHYHMEASQSNSLWWSWAPMEEPADRFVATFSAETPPDRRGEFGLVWGTGDEDFYLLRISPEGWYAIDRQTDGVWTAAVDSTLSDAIAPDRNRMQVVVDGSAVVVTINSVTVGGYRLPADLGPARVGIALSSIGFSGFAASFDDFTVSKLDQRVALADYTDFDSLGTRWVEDSQTETGVGYREEAYAIWTNVSNWTRWQRPPTEETYDEPLAVEATAFLASGDDASGNYGICFGPTSDPEGDTYYWFRVRADGAFAVEYCRDGVYQTSVLPLAPSSWLLTGSESNRLRVAASGGIAAVEANGSTLATFALGHVGPYWVGLSAGGVGIDTTPVEARFTRFAVYRAQ